MFPVDVKTLPNIKAERASTEGKDKSISPRVTTRVMANAMMPKKGMVDIKE
jgi:hypothetical protein